MPIYEYRCAACGHKLEALQKFTEAPPHQLDHDSEEQALPIGLFLPSQMFDS